MCDLPVHSMPQPAAASGFFEAQEHPAKKKNSAQDEQSFRGQMRNVDPQFHRNISREGEPEQHVAALVGMFVGEGEIHQRQSEE